MITPKHNHGGEAVCMFCTRFQVGRINRCLVINIDRQEGSKFDLSEFNWLNNTDFINTCQETLNNEKEM